MATIRIPWKEIVALCEKYGWGTAKWQRVADLHKKILVYLPSRAVEKEKITDSLNERELGIIRSINAQIALGGKIEICDVMEQERWQSFGVPIPRAIILNPQQIRLIEERKKAVDNKPGVMRTIVECLDNASRLAPITVDGIMEVLIWRFPGRSHDNMRRTVLGLVPDGLQRMGYRILGNKKLGYWLVQQEGK